MEQPKSTILVVDDEPIALDMMEGFLFPDGYEIKSACNGPEALTQIEQSLPDVILLDVMMPEMDGFEVCQRLKGDKRWHHIPIILVTALDSTEDLVRGLDAGADDFLNKPVDSVELRARVRSLLRIKKQYDQLENTLRLREDLTHMIMHDIRTPLTAILGFTELLGMRGNLTPTDADDVKAIQTHSYRLDAFINDMLILAKLESERLILNRSMVDVNQMVHQVKGSYDMMAKSRKINFVSELPSAGEHVLLDANLFQRLLENLISNAIKFSPSGGTVTLNLDYPRAKTLLYAAVPKIRIKVTDEGPGVAEKDRERIFDKFEIAKVREKGSQLGLGLAFCKMVIEAHGGQIFVEPNEPHGSVFTVEL